MCLFYTKYVIGEEKFSIVSLVECTVDVTV